MADTTTPIAELVAIFQMYLPTPARQEAISHLDALAAEVARLRLALGEACSYLDTEGDWRGMIDPGDLARWRVMANPAQEADG